MSHRSRLILVVIRFKARMGLGGGFEFSAWHGCSCAFLFPQICRLLPCSPQFQSFAIGYSYTQLLDGNTNFIIHLYGSVAFHVYLSP